MSERGQFVQDYTEVFDGAVTKCYIAYAAQQAGGRHDPEGEYRFSKLTIQVGPGTGTGTIRFFKEHVQTDEFTALTSEIPLDEIQSHLSLPIAWTPGPLHDIYFVTTGTAKGYVSLRAARISNSFVPSQEIIP